MFLCSKSPVFFSQAQLDDMVKENNLLRDAFAEARHVAHGTSRGTSLLKNWDVSASYGCFIYSTYQDLDMMWMGILNWDSSIRMYQT